MSDYRAGAIAYDQGQYEAARKLWQPLAERGHMVAQKSLATLYSKGQGVTVDLGKAAYWFEQAAAQGHASAQYKLGVIYAFGTGVPRDTVKARVWLARAIAAHPPGLHREKAAELAEMLDGAMTATERSAVADEMNRLRLAGALVPNERPPQRLDPRDPEGFRREVLGYVRRSRLGGDTLFAGSVQVLGLEQVHARMGASWAEVRPHIHQVVYQTVERHLTDLDLYVRVSEDRVILLFGNALKPEAEATARSIAVEIENRLADLVPGGAEISVASVAVPIDPGIDGAAVTSVESLARTLDRAVARRERESEAAAAEMAATTAPRYWPIAQLKKRMVSAYRIELVSNGSVDDEVAFATPDQFGQIVADLDRLIVETAARDLTATGMLHLKAMMLIPVHYETLANKLLRDRYVQALKRLPPTSKRRGIVHLLDMPAGVPQSRLFQILSMVAPFFRSAALRVPVRFQDFDRLAGSRIGLLTLDSGRFNALGKAELTDIAALVGQARRRRMRVFFEAAPTPETALAVKRSGVHYVDGPGVAPAVKSFGRAHRLG